MSVSVGSNPIAFVAGTTAASANAADVTTGAIDSTGANFLVAVVSDYGGATAGAVTDSKGNTWTARTIYTDGLVRVRIFYSVATSVGSGHTASYSATQPALGFGAFSNVNATPFDNEVGTTGSSLNPAGGSITPSANNALVISGISFLDFMGATVDSGFSLVGTSLGVSANNFALGIAYKIQTTAGATNPVWTIDNSNPWAATNAVFKN